MKILVCGANGQLGNECRALAPQYKEHIFLFTDIDELNICDAQEVSGFIRSERPDVVLNCAAYTAVDKAETDQEKAWLLNSEAAGFLARACKENNAFFIHVSTDYVFDGNAETPYKPDDPTSSASVYGASKRAGELKIQAENGNAMIIRTAWLYSSYGKNFVKTMLRLAKEKGTVNVVNDQFGSPTYAGDLAKAILTILPEGIQKKGVSTYHFTNTGIISWYQFALAIFELAGISCVVHPISTAEYPTATPRPHYSALDSKKFMDDFHYNILPWKQSLAQCLQLMNPNI